jgi:rubrerythrin
MFDLPPSIPRDSKAVYAYLGTIVKPTLHDLKLMVLLEAAGEGTYRGLADAAPTEEVRDLLQRNGREEVGHAHRVIAIIKKLYGEEVCVPPPEDNPYFSVPEVSSLSDFLQKAVGGELAGGKMYDDWAAQTEDEEVAKLLRQNAREERRHADRDTQALNLLKG